MSAPSGLPPPPPQVQSAVAAQDHGHSRGRNSAFYKQPRSRGTHLPSARGTWDASRGIIFALPSQSTRAAAPPAWTHEAKRHAARAVGSQVSNGPIGTDPCRRTWDRSRGIWFASASRPRAGQSGAQPEYGPGLAKQTCQKAGYATGPKKTAPPPPRPFRPQKLSPGGILRKSRASQGAENPEALIQQYAQAGSAIKGKSVERFEPAPPPPAPPPAPVPPPRSIPTGARLPIKPHSALPILSPRELAAKRAARRRTKLRRSEFAELRPLPATKPIMRLARRQTKPLKQRKAKPTVVPSLVPDPKFRPPLPPLPLPQLSRELKALIESMRDIPVESAPVGFGERPPYSTYSDWRYLHARTMGSSKHFMGHLSDYTEIYRTERRDWRILAGKLGMTALSESLLPERLSAETPANDALLSTFARLDRTLGEILALVSDLTQLSYVQWSFWWWHLTRLQNSHRELDQVAHESRKLTRYVRHRMNWYGDSEDPLVDPATWSVDLPVHAFQQRFYSFENTLDDLYRSTLELAAWNPENPYSVPREPLSAAEILLPKPRLRIPGHGFPHPIRMPISFLDLRQMKRWPGGKIRFWHLLGQMRQSAWFISRLRRLLFRDGEDILTLLQLRTALDDPSGAELRYYVITAPFEQLVAKLRESINMRDPFEPVIEKAIQNRHKSYRDVLESLEDFYKSARIGSKEVSTLPGFQAQIPELRRRLSHQARRILGVLAGDVQSGWLDGGTSPRDVRGSRARQAAAWTVARPENVFADRNWRGQDERRKALKRLRGRRLLSSQLNPKTPGDRQSLSRVVLRSCSRRRPSRKGGKATSPPDASSRSQYGTATPQPDQALVEPYSTSQAPSPAVLAQEGGREFSVTRCFSRKRRDSTASKGEQKLVVERHESRGDRTNSPKDSPSGPSASSSQDTQRKRETTAGGATPASGLAGQPSSMTDGEENAIDGDRSPAQASLPKPRRVLNEGKFVLQKSRGRPRKDADALASPARRPAAKTPDAAPEAGSKGLPTREAERAGTSKQADVQPEGKANNKPWGWRTLNFSSTTKLQAPPLPPGNQDSHPPPASTGPAPSAVDDTPSTLAGDPSRCGEAEATEFEYVMSKASLKEAMLASPNSKAATWTYRLYRNAQNQHPVVRYCITKEAAEKAAQDLANEKVLGFDLEWKPQCSAKHGIKANVSVIQLASESVICVFQIALHKGSTAEEILPPTVKKLMESPRIAKVGVSVKADCTRLRTYLGIDAKGTFELSHLYRLVKYSSHDPRKVNKRLVKLADIVLECLQLPLHKGAVRSSDWSRRLSYDQVEYAATDAYAGLRAFHALDQARRALKPTPPLPAFDELGLPIQLVTPEDDPGEGSDTKERTESIPTASEPSEDEDPDSFSEDLERLEASVDDGESESAVDPSTDGEVMGAVFKEASPLGGIHLRAAPLTEETRADVLPHDEPSKTYLCRPGSILYPNLPVLSTEDEARLYRPLPLRLSSQCPSLLDAPARAARPVAQLSTPSRPLAPHPDILAADVWAAAFKSSLPPSISTTAHFRRLAKAPLRVYALWHVRGLEPDEIAKLARDPPLATSTVATYILDCVQRLQLESECEWERMRKIMGMLPGWVVRGRYGGLAARIGESKSGEAGWPRV